MVGRSEVLVCEGGDWERIWDGIAGCKNRGNALQGGGRSDTMRACKYACLSDL